MRVEGVALEPHTKTHGSSGFTKEWPEQELRDAAHTLSGCPVNDTAPGAGSGENVIGQVLDSWYEDDEGVRYEASITDDELALKIETRELRLAPSLVHEKTDTSRDDGVQIPRNIKFNGLFLCEAVSNGVPGLGEWTIVCP